MILMVIGFVSLVLATIQHRHQLKILRIAYENMPMSTAGIVAGVILRSRSRDHLRGYLPFVSVTGEL